MHSHRETTRLPPTTLINPKKPPKLSMENIISLKKNTISSVSYNMYSTCLFSSKPKYSRLLSCCISAYSQEII